MIDDAPDEPSADDVDSDSKDETSDDTDATAPAPTASKLPPRGARSALEGIAEGHRKAMVKAIRPRDFTSILRTAELAQKAVANIDTIRVAPVLEQVSKTIEPLNARIRAQINVAMPPIALALPQIYPKLDTLNSAVSKGALGDLANLNVTSAAFTNLYGEQFSGIASKLVNVQKLFENIDWESLKAGWYPPNWDEDRGIEQYATFIELAAEEGLPMAWVPNVELTYLLVDADSAETREQLLIEHSATIVDDCRSVIGDFEDRTHLVVELRSALDAYTAGLHGPAQSHAAGILDTALRRVLTLPKRWTYPGVKKFLHTGDDWQSTELRAARILPTSVAMLNLLKDFWTERGDPIPSKPNRHACAHAVSPEQFHEANAIKYLMLATAMLAEIEHDGWALVVAKVA